MTIAEHRYNPATKGCVCGKTWTVAITIDDQPFTCEAHSSPLSLAALAGRDGSWHLRKGVGEAISFDQSVIMLEDGDSFYFVPQGAY